MKKINEILKVVRKEIKNTRDSMVLDPRTNAKESTNI